MWDCVLRTGRACREPRSVARSVLPNTGWLYSVMASHTGLRPSHRSKNQNESRVNGLTRCLRHRSIDAHVSLSPVSSTSPTTSASTPLKLNTENLKLPKKIRVNLRNLRTTSSPFASFAAFAFNFRRPKAKFLLTPPPAPSFYKSASDESPATAPPPRYSHSSAQAPVGSADSPPPPDSAADPAPSQPGPV